MGENWDAISFLIRNVYTEARKKKEKTCCAINRAWQTFESVVQSSALLGNHQNNKIRKNMEKRKRDFKKNRTKVGPNLGRLGPGETETNKLGKQDPHRNVLLLKNRKIGMKTIHYTAVGRVPN